MSEEFKYLRIKGIDDYQAEFKDLERGRYIKDAIEKDSNPEYSKLTFFQRHVLDGLRRLWALHQQNPPNDPAWIARALCAVRRDSSQVPHAIRTLIAHGLLIPCNEKDSFAKRHKVTKLNSKTTKTTEKNSYGALVPAPASQSGNSRNDPGRADTCGEQNQNEELDSSEPDEDDIYRVDEVDVDES